MSDKFQLGSYVWVPTGAASYTTLLNTFSSDVGATPTVANEGIDYSKPMSAWVAAAQWEANGLAASPGGASNTPVFALPLMSTSDTTTTALQAFNNIASGADDSIWRGIVQAYQADGFKTVYIRPGWEMNGNWMPWAVTNETEAKAFVAAFQHIADVVRSVAGIDVKMLWNPADTTNAAVPTQDTYPGDAYVDAMSTDIYSTLYPESLYDWSTGKMDTSIQQWWANPVNEEHYWDYPDATQYNPHGNGSGWGLVDALEFAVEHNKPFSLAETGAGDDGSKLGPVDNGLFPEYLAQRLLAAGAPSIAFATLWERVGTSYEFTDGNHPLETAAWADFVRKMEQGDAGPSLSTAAVTVGHNQTTNLLSALNTLITPGRTGDTETISHVSAATGHVTMGADGAILYTAGAAGTDTLTYTVTDQLGDVITATTTLVVDGGPTINAAATRLGHGQTITLAKLAASLVTPGQAGDVESFSHVSSANGTITVAADGTLSYTAPASGTDTLSYTVTDQYGDSVSGSSTLAIDPGPSLATSTQGATPGAVYSLAYRIGQLITPGLAGDKESVTAISAAHGTVVLGNTGAITYTAPASGTDTLTFTVTDQLGDTATGSYGVIVNPASIAGTASHFGGATDPSWGAADAGVTVRLLNAAGAVVATAVTTSNGYFSFPYNVAGIYQLQYVAPAGQAIQSGSKTVNPLTGLSSPFTVVANQQYVAPAAPMVSVGTLAGQVLTAGAGQAAMTVNLLNAAGTVTATTTTDSSGNFSFGHLAAASYQVQYLAPTGQALQAGGPANAATGITGQYALALGQTVTLATETITPPYASITGSVLLGSTLGEAGVSVSLLNAAGSAVQTTTTSTAGVYSFTGMASGSYSVQIAAPTGQVFQTGGAAAVGTGIISGITATLGQTTTVASENLLSSPGVIQSSVHHYGSADPLWGTAQYGVAVSLLNASGTVIASTVTDHSGWFSFGGLGAGSYQLQYTPTADEAMKAGNGVAASGLSTPVTLASGQNVFLPTTGVTSISNSFALTGNGSVALRGAGNYAVTGNGTGGTLTLGAGNSTVTLTGSGNTVTVGAGTESVTLGGANNVVHAAGGTVTITAGGANNLFDGGTGISFLNADGSAGNKFVLGASGQGLTTITGFNPATTDVLNLGRTLAGVSILANLSNVGSYLTAVTNGGNTSLYADLTGGHSTAGGAIATLTGVTTSVASLLSGHHLSMS